MDPPPGSKADNPSRSKLARSLYPVTLAFTTNLPIWNQPPARLQHVNPICCRDLFDQTMAELCALWPHLNGSIFHLLPQNGSKAFGGWLKRPFAPSCHWNWCSAVCLRSSTESNDCHFEKTSQISRFQLDQSQNSLASPLVCKGPLVAKGLSHGICDD